MKNPWEEINLEDYENHMQLDSVRQLQTMNSIMRSQFEAYPVCSAMVLGVAGGNGLDAVHHQMNLAELTSAMHAIGYDMLLQESNDLPNGKALVRLDYKKRGNMKESPRFKAVIFDLFETLITEWGHEKYTKRKMCADLGVDKDCFDPFWNEKGEEPLEVLKLLA